MTDQDGTPARPLTLARHDRETVRAFLRANTKVLCPPLVPEVRLHLAEESLPIWQKTEEDLLQENIPPPFWAFAWAGGQALARYILDHHDEIAGKTVLDLGTGSGLTAIAAARAGAADVLASDIDPLAVITTELNAELNAVSVAVTSADLLHQPPDTFDVILIADLFYERGLAEDALTYIRQAKALGAKIWVGDPSRSYFPKDQFQRLETYKVEVTRDLEDALIKQTAVWQF